MADAAVGVDDVIVGNAVPEAEQGLQVGRIIAARAVGLKFTAEVNPQHTRSWFPRTVSVESVRGRETRFVFRIPLEQESRGAA